MIFFSLILLIKSCPYMDEMANHNIHIYPTNGEYFEYPIGDLNLGENLIYHYDPIIPNVQIPMVFNEISKIDGYEFISISSNQTHFVTITKDNLVILYEWKNYNIQQYGQIFRIEEKYQCYNIILFIDIHILLDCYAEEHFHLLKLMNTSFNIVYSIQANNPITSKIQGIYNESKSFLIYTQYYQNISILTLFSSQYQNLSFYQNQFIEIGIPIRENPYIYILFGQSISQFIIMQNYSFNETSNYQLNTNANSFQVYYDYQVLSQCDQLLTLSQDQSNQEEVEAYGYLGCQYGLSEKQGYSYVFEKETQLNQFFFDYELVLFQFQTHIVLYSQKDSEYSIGYIEIDENTQIYFNTDYNYLFTFNKQIIVYQLTIPSLQINLTDQQQVQGKTYDITIYAKYFNLTFKGICKLFMSITILDQNDTNVYPQMILSNNQQFPMYKYFNDRQQYIYFFGKYSGKLLSYTINTDNKQFGSFTQNSYTKLVEFQNQKFYLAQLLNTLDIFESQIIYFIGVTNEQIQIYNQTKYYVDSFNPYMTINISIKAESLQVAYNIYGILIIGLSDNNTIYIYQIQLTQYYFQFKQFEQQFSQFLVTFNNLIILYLNREIQIMTLNFTDVVIINENLINQLFKRDILFQFNPIQIAINTQLLSSCLFINNINNIIVIAIGQNNRPIPISIIEFTFQIKQINIVNQQLVLSYICNSDLDLCFQVWSIQNLKQSFFMKNMMSVHYQNQLHILSDNLFFYVQFSNYTVYIYNPYYPEHMSLQYQLNLSSQLISTINKNIADYNQIDVYNYIGDYNYIDDYNSYLYYENQIYKLSVEQSFELKINQSLNFERSYPQIIYNYSVTSLLNQTAIQQTYNQSFTYGSNFTFFQPKANKTINLQIQDLNFNDQTFTIPMNLILDRQTSLCYFPNSSYDNQQDQYFSNHTCDISNFGYSLIYNQNYTLVTAVNNQFFVLQNNNYIQIVNQQFQNLSYYNYSYLNFTECLKSTSYNLTLSSICQNTTAQYWLSISFDSYGNVLDINLFYIPYRFKIISKINNIANLNFIQGAYNSTHQGLYLFNSLNSSMQQLGCKSDSYPFDCIIYQDFSVALFNSSFDINKQNLIIIFFISYEDFAYQYLQFRMNSFDLADINYFYKKSYQGSNLLGVQIVILQIINNKIFILITTKNGIGILFVYIFISTQKPLVQFDIITTIPIYDNLLPNGNSIYSNGLLLQQFTQGNNYIIGVYQISKFFNKNLEDPILMLGSLQSTSPEYALIGNIEYQNATCIALNKGSLLYYPIDTRTLKCHYRQRRNTIQVNISCKNKFSNGSYEITFILPELDRNKRGWIYSLIIIITVLLIGFYILVKYRMRNFGYINTEIEL